MPNQRDQHPEDLAVSASANRNTDDSLSKQVARLSVDYKTLGTSDDERPDNNRNKNTRAAQPKIRLQGSVDLSADESEDESNQDSDDGVKVEIKEEKKDEAKAITLPDPAVFTISLGVYLLPTTIVLPFFSTTSVFSMASPLCRLMRYGS